MGLAGRLGRETCEKVRERAAELVRELEGPPFDLSCARIREAVGIHDIRFSPALAGDGRIVRKDGGYLVELNPAKPAARRRFTLAHEIAHTFFMSGDGRAERVDIETGSYAQRSPEEYLCDLAAGEMLMPTNLIRPMVFSYGPSARSIVAVARRFECSFDATAHRFMETGLWRCHVGFWRVAPTGTIQLEHQLRSGVDLGLSAGVRAGPGSIIARAVTASRCVEGWADIGLVSPWGEHAGKRYTQALYLKGARRILSVVVLEKYPDSLCRMVEAATQSAGHAPPADLEARGQQRLPFYRWKLSK